MPLIDLSAITPATMTLRDRRGQVWELSDEVPAEDLLPTFDLYALDDEIDRLMRAVSTPADPTVDPDPDAPTPAELSAAIKDGMAERIKMTTSICHAIFRVSYPAMTVEEVCAALPKYADRRMVVNAFFSLLFAGSSMPSSASSASDTPTTPDEERSSPQPTTTTPTPAVTASSTLTTVTRTSAQASAKNAAKALATPRSTLKPVSPQPTTTPPRTTGSPRGVAASGKATGSVSPNRTNQQPVRAVPKHRA